MCYDKFPEGYTFLDKIDLQHNKKQFWAVQGICLAIAVVFVVIGCFISSPAVLYSGAAGNLIMYIVAAVVLIAGMVAYVILHELTHALFMRTFVKTKVKFGFVGWAAYAGCNAYYDKKHYVIIALAPLVVWGVIFGVLNIVFHAGLWFWVIWFLQTINVSGAAGDIFVSCKMARYPKDILVCDTGTDMSVFRRKTAEEIAAQDEVTQTEENGDTKID